MPAEEEIEEGMADPPPLVNAQAAQVRLQKVLKFWRKKQHRSFEKKIL